MASYIRRRKFLATLGGAAAWPFAVRAQQARRPKRVYLAALRPGCGDQYDVSTALSALSAIDLAQCASSSGSSTLRSGNRRRRQPGRPPLRR